MKPILPDELAYRNLNHDGTTKQIKDFIFLKENESGVATNVYLRKTLEKTKKNGLRILKMSSGVIYA